MATSPKFIFYLMCLLFGKMAQMSNFILSTTVHQESGFILVDVGESINLQCFYVSDDRSHNLSQRPTSILMEALFMVNLRTIHVSDRTFFTWTFQMYEFQTQATYYCAGGDSLMLEFMEGITVSVKGSGLNIQALVHQSASETVQPGGSVTLSCTVHPGTCDGEHSVYWFKNSEEPHPGLIYTHGDRDDQCERRPNTQTHTCVYNLSMKSLNVSHAGTYYCAVASCGHVLFGNGTKLDFEDEVDCHTASVYYMSGALIFTTILSVVLAFLLYKRNGCGCSETGAGSSPPSTTNPQVYQDTDDVHFAAVSVNLPNRSRRQRDNTMEQCVYSSVRQ